MKIAFFHFSYDGAGGVEKFLSVWAGEFIKQGHEVYFISINRSGSFIYDLDDNVKFIDLKYPMKRLTVLKPFLTYSIFKTIKNYEIDVIIGQSIKASYILGWAAKRYPINAVGMEHLGYDCELHGAKHRRLREKYYPYLKGFVTLTPDDEEPYRAMGVANVQTIFNPVSTPPKTGHDASSKILLSVGRQDGQKNYSALLRVFKRLGRNDLTLKIVGKDYGMRPTLIEESKALGIADKVQFIDFNKNISDFYLNSAVFLLTSAYEGLPLVLIEAKAHGLPCVSFDSPTGPRHIINDGKDGFLIPMNDEETMARKISEYLDNPDLQLSMSAAGIEDVKRRFSVDVLYKQWVKFLKAIAG